MSKWFNFDARGNQSKTLMFVAVSWLVVVVKFALAGLNLGPFGIIPAMGASEFGAAVALILAIWLGREWTEKSK